MEKLNKYIDHTLLKPDATEEAIRKLCLEAKENNFATVCLNPTHIKLAKSLIGSSKVGICTVIGFPLGAGLSSVKAFETRLCIDLGANEIDMVINIGAVKDGRFEDVTDDISEVVEAASGRTVKVILETCLLTNDEIIEACKAALKAKAHFVKTSTGFSTGGATVEAVKLMKETVGDKLLVKASGGVRSYEDAMAMIEAGASRLGTSSSLAIVGKEGPASKGY
ncbi:MAG: deoxyribose-phosphate aldolase [Bacteriovoracaceae bacterium]|nr:deoxyribose-phosphate aldolase [Bacteriovoracaceae bacterium]